MVRIEVTTDCSIDLRVDGVDLSGAFKCGVLEVDPAVAELLIAQGFAVHSAAKKPAAEKAKPRASRKPAKATDPVITEPSTQDEPAEAIADAADESPEA